MALIWNTVASTNVTIFGGDGQPIFTRFTTLTPQQQEQAFQGLKDRIQRETLQGYVDRKREGWGDRAYTAVIDVLRARDLLESGRPFPETYGEWVYTKVGDTEVRGRQEPSGVEIQHVSGQFDQTDFDAAVKIIEARLSESGYAAPGRPFPKAYGDWVDLSESIKEKYPDDPAMRATVSYQLGIIAREGEVEPVVEEKEVEEAKRWLTRKAGDLGIR